jgi:hypothetical protein
LGRIFGIGLKTRCFHISAVIGKLTSSVAGHHCDGPRRAGSDASGGSVHQAVLRIARNAWWDGIVCARMATAVVTVGPSFLSLGGGSSKTAVRWVSTGRFCECRSSLMHSHRSIDEGSDLNLAKVSSIQVHVAPGVKTVASFEDSRTPLKAKFSITHCVAAALAGKELKADRVFAATLVEESLRALCSRSRLCRR